MSKHRTVVTIEVEWDDECNTEPWRWGWEDLLDCPVRVLKDWTEPEDSQRLQRIESALGLLLTGMEAAGVRSLYRPGESALGTLIENAYVALHIGAPAACGRSSRVGPAPAQAQGEHG